MSPLGPRPAISAATCFQRVLTVPSGPRYSSNRPATAWYSRAGSPPESGASPVGDGRVVAVVMGVESRVVGIHG